MNLIQSKLVLQINRIYHRSLRQIKKSQSSGQQIMSENRFLPSFRHHPLIIELGFIGLHRRPMSAYFSICNLLLGKS